MNLIFIHGRAQEEFDEQELKQTWITTFHEGLAKNKLTLPAGVNIEFPYYGKLLKQWVEDPGSLPQQAIIKRSGRVVSEDIFNYTLLNEMLTNADGEQEPTRGLLNKEAIQKLLRKLDAKSGWGELALKKFTKDVFLYLTNVNLQQALNEYVMSKFGNEPSVVVGHSLGTIVAYNILKSKDDFQVKKFITLGSPLGLVAVKKYLPQPAGLPKCVKNGWFNAYDERDFVALNPLDSDHFPCEPPIENKNDIDNFTKNRHGIAGYLNDAVVAKTIYDALILQ